MSLNVIPSLPLHRWVSGRGLIFALLGLLALDGGLCATSAFGQTATGFTLSPTTLAYTATVGSPNQTASITVTNTGSTAITVTYADSIDWSVAITPGLSQTIQPGKSGTFTLTASFASLAAGSYSGTGTISGGGITKQVPVTLTLTASTGSGTIGATTLAWGANTETDLSDYKVYQRTASGAYAAPVATLPKTTTSFTATGLQTGTTYYFVITAYDNAGNESLPSSEVSKSIY